MDISDLLEITNHVKRWLINLHYAQKERKKQSIDALQSVVLAAWETTVYLCEIRDQDKQSIEKKKKLAAREKKLSEFWTELSLHAAKLKLDKLSKGCRELGHFWSSPEIHSFHTVMKAPGGQKKDSERLKDRLDDIEQLAGKILEELI